MEAANLLPLSEIHNSADIVREIPHLMIRIRKVEQRTTGFRFRTNSDRRKRDLPHRCGLFRKTDNHRIVVPLVPDIQGQLNAREDREDEDGYPEETLEDGTLLLAQVPNAVDSRVVAVFMDDGLGRLEAAAVLDLLFGVHLVLAVIGHGLAERRRQTCHQSGPLPLVGGGQGRLGQADGHLLVARARGVRLGALGRHPVRRAADSLTKSAVRTQDSGFYTRIRRTGGVRLPWEVLTGPSPQRIPARIRLNSWYWQGVTPASTAFSVAFQLLHFAKLA